MGFHVWYIYAQTDSLKTWTTELLNTAILFLFLSLFLELLTLWSVLVWHFSPRSSRQRVDCMLAHACVFFRHWKKHSSFLQLSFYMVLTQSLDPDAHNPTVLPCMPITFALVWFLMIIDHCMRDCIYIYIYRPTRVYLYISSKLTPHPPQKTCTLILLYHTKYNIILYIKY